MHDDRRIIELLNQRDEQVLQIIQKQYGAFCYQVAFRIIGNREDAEECRSPAKMAACFAGYQPCKLESSRLQ